MSEWPSTTGTSSTAYVRRLVTVSMGTGRLDGSAYTQPDLRGWKTIAAHFDVSVSTAKVWARDTGHPMPVYRHRGRVEAYSAELDEWAARERESISADAG